MNVKSNRFTFYTIFQRSKNVHLVKDVGMIPFIMHKYYGYDSYYCTYKCDYYTYIDNEVKGLNLILLGNEDLPNEKDAYKIKLGVIKFLLTNSKKINVLHLMHLNKTTLAYALIYKLINRKGIVYIKADRDPDYNPETKTLKWKVKYLTKKLIQRFKIIDILSVETNKGLAKLSYEFNKDILLYIPNGFYKPEWLNDISFKKENIILTVGRLGTKQKATEVLLEAFANIKNLLDWRLVLVGPIAKSFEGYIKEYYQNHPHLKDKVVFTGEISDRKLLYEYYKKAKIFVLPSRWEGFSLSMIEAAFFGCYIVATNVGAAEDILEITNYGKIVKKDDPKELANILQDLIINWREYEKDPHQINKIVDEHFNWIKICGKLDQRIKEIIAKKGAEK